jgi:hypothetical protein
MAILASNEHDNESKFFISASNLWITKTTKRSQGALCCTELQKIKEFGVYVSADLTVFSGNQTYVLAGSRLHIFYARSVYFVSVIYLLPTNNQYAITRQLSQFHSDLTVSDHTGTIYCTQQLISCSCVINV